MPASLLPRPGSDDLGVGPERILIVALNYAPEQVGCAKYTSEMAEELVRRGHEVAVVCGPPYYPQWSIPDGYSGRGWSRESLNGVRLHRTPLYVPRKPNSLKRIAHLASFGLGALPVVIQAVRKFKPTVVFAVAPTLASSGTALVAARLAGARSWLHIQDFEVDAAFELGLLRNKAVRRVAQRLEAMLFKGFDKVSSISPAMTALLLKKGVPAPRVYQLRNWVDIDAIRVMPVGASAYRSELNIPSDHLVALYSGNMAAKQGIEMLAEVARALAVADAPVTLVLCGEGPARAGLEGACKCLSNVRFLPLQPLARLNDLLGSADIHLLPQRPEAADLVLPSKLTGMLASGRAVVAMARPGSGLAAEVEGCGLSVEPEVKAMTQAILDLVADPAAREVFAAEARARAEARWCKDAIITQFEQAIAETRREAVRKWK